MTVTVIVRRTNADTHGTHKFPIVRTPRPGEAQAQLQDDDVQKLDYMYRIQVIKMVMCNDRTVPGTVIHQSHYTVLLMTTNGLRDCQVRI